jgi:hypothetical protein
MRRERIRAILALHASRAPSREQAGLIRLAIDYEHAARTWWEKGGQELWDGITEGFDGSSVVLDDALAESWLAEARRIPGWDDGPEYAPNPVIAAPVDEETEPF